MILNVENSEIIDKNHNDHKMIDVNVINEAKYPLTFDCILFGNSTIIGNQEYYKLFVKLNLKDNKFFVDNQKDFFDIIGKTSSASFILNNSNGLTELTDGDGNKKHTFVYSKIGKDLSYSNNYFFVLKIPKKQVVENQINKIEFKADIASPICGQKFQGAIYVNFKKLVVESSIDNKTKELDVKNNVAAYFNYTSKISHLGYTYLLGEKIMITDKSILNNNYFNQDYLLNMSHYLNIKDYYDIDKSTLKYIQFEKENITNINNNYVSSELSLEDFDEKIISYYNTDKIDSNIYETNAGLFEIKTSSSSFFDFSKHIVKILKNCDKYGILLINDKKINFINHVSIYGIDFMIENKVLEEDKKWIINIDYNIKDLEFFKSYILNVDRSKLKSLTIDYIEKYISENEKIA